MYNFANKFAGLVNGTYPNITGKNASGPTLTDGTPFTADFINDFWGWMQAVLNSCPDSIDRTPNGVAESASLSQILTAFRRGVALPPGIILHCAHNAATLAKMRLLQLAGQRIEIAVYPELAAAVYPGDAANPTAPSFYKCDLDGTRNTSGLYMQLPDCRGLFLRGAGTNGSYTDAASHQGGSVGQFINDEIRNIIGHTGNTWGGTPGPSGAFSTAQYLSYNWGLNSNWIGGQQNFLFRADQSTGNSENPMAGHAGGTDIHPASISANLVISY